MRADHAMLELARQLSDKVDIAVLTNNTTLVGEHIDTLLPELRPLFGSQIFSSAQFKAAKPDPQCYRRCLSALGMKAATALFVDDLPADVAGAREAGLFAHCHTSVEAFRQALSGHGLLPD
jgi:putative hydrolase of the HAD superfamily